ncbi:MAG: hypothetical protein KZQ73_00665 [Candidatus Thiodiazotropha sp. (ex Semelilucina semeliformis)]|nr:hypothetical protein [Candidatus Thiodiazotropha sp. (ex Semelilucina semeliformis)]
MKTRFLFSLLLMLTLVSIDLSACQVSGAKITRVFQWSDGHIFIVVDKQNDCGCSMSYRFAFHKNDGEKFFHSAALTALSGGNLVELRGDSACDVHGNTPKLKVLFIDSN